MFIDGYPSSIPILSQYSFALCWLLLSDSPLGLGAHTERVSIIFLSPKITLPVAGRVMFFLHLQASFGAQCSLSFLLPSPPLWSLDTLRNNIFLHLFWCLSCLAFRSRSLYALSTTSHTLLNISLRLIFFIYKLSLMIFILEFLVNSMKQRMQRA